MNRSTINIAVGLAALAAGWYIFQRSQSGAPEAKLLGMFLTGGALASILTK